MLPFKNRLKKEKDFKEVFEKGKDFKEDSLYLKTKEGSARFGFVVSKKVSPKASVRNRIKRKLREAVKKELPKMTKKADCVIVVLPGFKDTEKIEQRVKKLFKKAKLNG